VFDPATATLVFKMLQNKTLLECDSHSTVKTGKEACLFYGVADLDSEQNCHVNRDNFSEGCAIKIFKTTLNEFSNRSDYFDGDHRFGKFNKLGTSRAAIAKWAEKEFRNLMRVNKRSKLRAPEALLFKEHIVIMSFIGCSGVPAPQLREVPRASLSLSEWTSIYLDTITVIYSLYHDCNLVHGDLSEYNLLWHNRETYVIDFGQAVDTSHPDHITFLLRDISTVSCFFEKLGVSVLDPDVTLSLVMQSVKVLDAVMSSYRNTNANGAVGICDESKYTSNIDIIDDVESREKLITHILLQYVD